VLKTELYVLAQAMEFLWVPVAAFSQYDASHSLAEPQARIWIYIAIL